jgi:hypothetical protein
MADTAIISLRIIIPYAQRRVFPKCYEGTQRWAIIVAHQRAGKNVAAVNKLIRAAAECILPDARYGYVSSHLGQAKEIAWNYLRRSSEPPGGEPPNETELWVTLLNGAQIRQTDNPDQLRGPNLVPTHRGSSR